MGRSKQSLPTPPSWPEALNFYSPNCQANKCLAQCRAPINICQIWIKLKGILSIWITITKIFQIIEQMLLEKKNIFFFNYLPPAFNNNDKKCGSEFCYCSVQLVRHVVCAQPTTFRDSLRNYTTPFPMRCSIQLILNDSHTLWSKASHDI